MKTLKILGTGCPKCKQLAELTDQVARQMGIEFQLEKVTDLREIMKFGVMMTPGLVVDGQVKVAGKVPTADEIKKMLM